MINRIVHLAIFAAFFAVGVIAQTSTATLSGTVSDENNAAVAGATVTVMNTENGVKRTVVTNDNGSFTIPLLQPSTYQVTVQQNNFAPFEANDVILNTNDSRFLNIRLKVGGVAEKVVVEASTVEVNMSPEVSTVVDQNLVDRMPLNGRTIQNLVALAPGTLPFTASSQANVGQISVNGLRTTQNYMTIDGVSANLYVGTNNSLTSQTNGVVPGFSQLGTTSNLVSVDALQEFKVQTSNYSAEYGRSPGAQIQLTTRSGTNNYRGTLYEYFRNEKLDANDWFANSGRLGRAPLRHNNFGFTFSGPLPTPRFGDKGGSYFTSGKNRTFFFFSYEGTRIRLPQVLNSVVPAVALRNSANAALRPLFSIFPQPTGPDNANGTTAPYIANYSNPQTQDSYALRLDHKITEKISLFGRYSHSPQDSTTLLPVNSTAQSLTGNTRTLTIGLNAAIKPNLTNEFRFNWSRNFAVNSTNFYSTSTTSPPPVSSYLLAPLTNRSQVLFTLAGSLFSIVPQNSGLRKQINITDTLTWVKGNHLFKAGIDYRRSPSRQESPDFQLAALFLNAAAVQTATAASFQLSINSPLNTDYSWQNFGAFIQDTWRVSKRLTLDYGVRWDVNPPPDIEPARRYVIVDFVNPIRLAEPGAKLYPTVWNAFAPRIGAAYRLFDKQGRETVLRGGYGMFYDLGSAAGANSSAFFPFSATKTAANVVFPFSAAVMTPPTIVSTPPYPSSNSYLVQYDKDFVLPRVHQWNFAVEQGLGKDQTLSVSYVGNAGRRQLRSGVLAPISRVYPIASPDFNANTNLTIFSNAPGRGDSSDYNAMQVQFTKRGRHVSSIVNYTWSHAFDTSSTTSNVLSTNFFRVDPRVDRAESSFDRRHVFSMAVTWSLPSVSPDTNKVLNAITRGWSLDGMFQYQTAYPIEIQYRNLQTSNNLGSLLLRPDIVEGQPIWIDNNGPLGRRLNPAAFSIPTVTRQGNMARNRIRVGALWQPDVALSRTFAFSERIKLRFKAEAFNVVNHPMFASPVTLMGTKNANGSFTANTQFGTFDRMLNRTPAGEGIALSSLYAPGGPRSIQLSARLSF